MPRGSGKRPYRRSRAGPSGGFISDATAAVRAVQRLQPYALMAFKGAASLVNAEFKHADVSTSSTVSTTPVLSFLTGIAQGDSNITRDGNSVKIMGLWGDVRISMNASATQTSTRTLIVCDTRNQGATPTASDIFDTSNTSGQGLVNIDTEPNRFVILFDRYDTQVLASETRLIHFRFDVTDAVRNMHLLWSGTGATVTSAKGPVIYLVQMSSEATNTPTYHLDTRLLFVDN